LDRFALLKNVMNTLKYDALILGSGQAANPLAPALAAAGKKTALVESKHVGGTCINEGCTPTKTMVASARVAYLARRAADYGVGTGAVTLDMKQVRARKQKIVDSFRGGNEKRLRSAKNVELIFGKARFVGEKTVHVALNDGSESTLQADQVFINVGCRSTVPKIAGLSDVPFLDNVSIMELTEVPEHLLVLGGGYIGVEFGQMFRRFGSRVTILQKEKQLLPHEDEDVAEAVHSILEQDGIEILFGVDVERVEGADKSITLHAKLPDGTKKITGSHLLLAVGRTPNSDGLDAAAAGLEMDARGFIRTNEYLETNVPGIYVLGDVKGGPAFTHISYDDYRIVQANVLHGERRSIRDRLVPYTVFTDPELGRIGLSEREARAQGRKIRVAKMPMTYVARALEKDETRGFMKAIVDAESGKILGAAILGIEGGETATMLQIAMMGGLPYTALRDAVFSHPTLAESLNNLFFQWDEKS
jgi:pyruvate/2-oxoglutarate dehydrogenase complex dihydrolipoamide dehydrogenase (E3) component